MSHVHRGHHRDRQFTQAQHPQDMQPHAHFDPGFGPVLPIQGRLRILAGTNDRNPAAFGKPSFEQAQALPCYQYTRLV